MYIHFMYILCVAYDLESFGTYHRLLVTSLRICISLYNLPTASELRTGL